MRLGAALLAALCAHPCLAATIEVKVVGPDGAPVAKAGVGLGDPLLRPRVTSSTDENGIAKLERVAVGHWKVAVEPPVGSLLFSKDRGGLTVNVQAADEFVTVTALLGAGDLVRGKIVGHHVPEHALIRFWGGPDSPRDLVFDESGNASVVLGPGRWLLAVEPSPGLAWTAVEIDGRPWPEVMHVETRGEGRTRHLTWTFATPGRLSGKVSIEGASQRVQVVARLKQEGAWGATARALGWMPAMEAFIGLKRDGTFDRDLADGSWVVTVEGEGVLEVDPPSIPIELVPGGSALASFRVKTGGDAKGARGAFVVSVRNADGKPVDGAEVEVRALHDGLPDGPRVASGRTFTGTANLPALIPKGDYVVAASHETALWSSVVLRDVEIQDGETVRAELNLRRGGSVSARVVEPSRVRPLLQLRRIDPPVATPFQFPSLAGTSSDRRMEIDARGIGFESGLEPGRFRVVVAHPGADAESRLVRLRLPDGEAREELELQVGEGAPAAFEVVDEPAAAANALVECEDGSAVDNRFELRGYREGANEPGYEGHLGLKDDRRVTWGPIPPGRWRFEFEPSSFARRTWAPGTEIPADAQTYTLEADGVPKDLGTIRVDCAPAARLTVYVDPPGADSEEVPSPDLRLARLEGRFRESDDAPWQPLKGLSVAASKEAIYVHKLPEGEGTLEITIRHPHLLDEPFAVATLRGKRYRGGLHQAVAEAPGLGGAIVYSKAKRLRLVPRPEGVMRAATGQGAGNGGFAVKPGAPSAPVPGDLEPRIVAIDPDWGAAVSIAPGVYDVHACGEPDPDCERVEKLWSGLRVQAGSTIELR